MKRRLHEARGEDGVSLVELLVAISLFALVGTLTLNSVVTGFRSQTKLTDRSTAMAELRTAAQRISREIREADPVRAATPPSLTMRRAAGTGQRELVLSVVGTELVQDARAVGSTGPAVRTVLLRNVDPTVTLFGYGASGAYTAVAGIDPVTCRITGSSPVRHSTECVGTVVLHLSRTLPQGSTILLDQTIELRNA